MNMEHEYYILKEKTYHTSPTGKTTGSFGYLQFKNRENEERILQESLRGSNPFSLMDKVEFAFNFKVGGATLGDYHEHSTLSINENGLFSSRASCKILSSLSLFLNCKKPKLPDRKSTRLNSSH